MAIEVGKLVGDRECECAGDAPCEAMEYRSAKYASPGIGLDAVEGLAILLTPGRRYGVLI